MTQKPLILAVESSGRIGSVALATGPHLLAETILSGPFKHTAEIFPAIQNLLARFRKKPDDIRQIHISIGPGSFTGLRIAVTLAKTLHLATAARIVPVDSLDVIAANVINLTPASHQPPAPSAKKLAPILDAKRGQFYIALYQLTHQTPHNTHYEKTLADCLMTAEQFLEQFACKEKPIWLLGDGLLYHQDKFKSDGTRFLNQNTWSPRSSKVHQLGWKLALQNKFADPLTLVPNYLMRPHIKLKKT